MGESPQHGVPVAWHALLTASGTNTIYKDVCRLSDVKEILKWRQLVYFPRPSRYARAKVSMHVQTVAVMLVGAAGGPSLAAAQQEVGRGRRQFRGE